VREMINFDSKMVQVHPPRRLNHSSGIEYPWCPLIGSQSTHINEFKKNLYSCNEDELCLVFYFSLYCIYRYNDMLLGNLHSGFIRLLNQLW